MLLLISLGYCGIIWLLFFKLKVLPWNKTSRNTSVVVGVVLILGIVIALFQGSPGTTLPISVQTRVVQISSGVNGRIVKIHVKPNDPVAKGAPLFDVDPVPYQNEVSRLTAQLAEAQSGVLQMEETLNAAQASAVDLKARLALAQGIESRIEGEVKASTDAAEAGVVTATETLRLAQLDWDRNAAQVEKAIEAAAAQLRAQKAIRIQAELEEKRSKQLLSKNTISQNDYDIRVRNVETAKANEEAIADALDQTRLSGDQQTDTRRANLATAKSQLVTAEATLTSAQLSGADRTEKADTDVRSLTAKLEANAAEVAKSKAWLAPNVEGEHVSVRQVRDALATAEFNLGQTTTYAPANGFVATMVAAEGTFARMMTVLSFVSTDDIIVAAPISQSTSKHIKPGDEAELSIRSYPGSIVTGTVRSVVFASSEAQLKPGNIASASQALASQNAIVIIEVNDPDHPLEFGMTGSGAIYTDTASAFGVIRKVMIRMDSLLNFLF